MEFNMLSLILCIAGFVVGGIVFFFVGTTYRKKVAEKEIGSAEEEARRIINEAIKGGESKKREMLLEAFPISSIAFFCLWLSFVGTSRLTFT